MIHHDNEAYWIEYYEKRAERELLANIIAAIDDPSGMIVFNSNDCPPDHIQMVAQRNRAVECTPDGSAPFRIFRLPLASN